MKRLTERNEDGTVFYPYCFQDDTCGGNGASEMCGTCAHEIQISERLAAYEDTGLTPEEIMELKRFLQESAEYGGSCGAGAKVDSGGGTSSG